MPGLLDSPLPHASEMLDVIRASCAVCQRGTRNLALDASCAMGLGAKLFMFMFGRRSVGFELAQVYGKPSLCSYRVLLTILKWKIV